MCLPAPLEGPPVALVRAGAIVPIELSAPGFAPARHEPGLWIFPPSPGSQSEWQYTLDDGISHEPGVTLEGQCLATDTEVRVTVSGDDMHAWLPNRSC